MLQNKKNELIFRYIKLAIQNRHNKKIDVDLFDKIRKELNMSHREIISEAIKIIDESVM